LHYLDHCGAYYYAHHCGEDEEDQGEEDFYGGFCGGFFGAEPTGGAERV